MKSCPWEFLSHSIPFVSSQANPSLGLPLGAPTFEQMSGSTGCAVFFNGSQGAVAGAGGIVAGVISWILGSSDPAGLSRALPIFALRLRIKLGRGLPHSIISISHRLHGDLLCNTLRTASSKKNTAAPQSRGVKGEKLLGKSVRLTAHDPFSCPRVRRSPQAVCEPAVPCAHRPGRGS